ncbi:hypothetical protein [Deferrisoma camini]|uniref:hypothetical protein n=1 Tax=Deferrisoma camini TaxID=1035120 RepID=UPI00046D37BB|nr:hypothetical protein [Deferrisoma camini]
MQTAEKATDLVVIDNQRALPAVQTRLATDAAGACKEIVIRTAQQISGRKYVRVEGWQAIANAFGCVASARDVERVEGGYRAIGEVRRIADGMVIATAEGFVGDDEKLWAKRPEYARRAMAQTRAISRACRSAFAFVVVLMDAGLETTPAEEMVGVEIVDDSPRPNKTPSKKPSTKKNATSDPVETVRALAREQGLTDSDLLDYVRAAPGETLADLGTEALRELYRDLKAGAVPKMEDVKDEPAKAAV